MERYANARLGRVPIIIGVGIVPVVANAPSALGRVAHYWVSLGSAKRVSTAMFEVCPLMFGKQFYDAAPKPVGRIERFRAITPKFALPLLAKGSIHLPAMGLANDDRESMGHFLGLLLRQIFNLNF